MSKTCTAPAKETSFSIAGELYSTQVFEAELVLTAQKQRFL